MTSKTGSATGALTQFDESLWACTQEELEQAVKDYTVEFGDFDADHFLDLKFHLVKGDATGRHRSYVLHLANSLHLTGPPRFSEAVQGTAPIEVLMKIPDEGENLPPTPPAYSFPEMALDELADVVSSTIVHDIDTKLLVFLAFLLNYTGRDQQNIGINSPSCSGKSYVVLQASMYFPDEDIIDLGYASAQAFYHESGALTLPDGTPILSRARFVSNGLEEWEEEHPKPEKGAGIKEWRAQRTEFSKALKERWDEVEKVVSINLKQKIVLFLDQPDDILQQRIRPFLSHDKEVITAKITDKSEKGGNRTKTVKLIGFPTVAFLSTRFSLDEQERSRMWWLSAGVGAEKIEGSLHMQGDVLKDRRKFKSQLDTDEARKQLQERVLGVKQTGIDEIVLSDDDMAYLVESFLQRHNGNLIPRHLRDFPRLVAIAKAHALLNVWTRERDDDVLYVERTDVEAALDLYNRVAPSNELGVPPVVYEFWVEKLSPALEDAIDIQLVDGVEAAVPRGLSRREMAILYHEYFRDRIGTDKARRWIDMLCEVGLVSEEPDPNDGRSKRIYAQGVGGKNSPPSKTVTKPQPSTSQHDGQLTLDIHESSEPSEHAGPVDRSISARADLMMRTTDQLTDDELESTWPPSTREGTMDFSDDDRFAESMECDEDE